MYANSHHSSCRIDDLRKEKEKKNSLLIYFTEQQSDYLNYTTVVKDFKKKERIQNIKIRDSTQYIQPQQKPDHSNGDQEKKNCQTPMIFEVEERSSHEKPYNQVFNESDLTLKRSPEYMDLASIFSKNVLTEKTLCPN